MYRADDLAEGVATHERIGNLINHNHTFLKFSANI